MGGVSAIQSSDFCVILLPDKHKVITKVTQRGDCLFGFFFSMTKREGFAAVITAAVK